MLYLHAYIKYNTSMHISNSMLILRLLRCVVKRIETISRSLPDFVNTFKFAYIN